jgi:hypothetical protein
LAALLFFPGEAQGPEALAFCQESGSFRFVFAHGGIAVARLLFAVDD